MDKITVKPKGADRVYNCDSRQYIEGETAVAKTKSVIRSLKKGELEVVDKKKRTVQKPLNTKKDKE